MSDQPSPQPPSAGSRRAATGSADSARIMVVDDQPANIQMVGSILGKHGFEVVPAMDGSTALKRLALRPPDLILLDLHMPDMDGIEVCHRIRQNPANTSIPVIFLSAEDDKDQVVRALDAGGVDYITKPFNHSELISRVETQLALKNARDRLEQLAADKDELMGILAHDLKNHLGGMQMSAQLLQKNLRDSPDTRPKKLAENILRSSSQLLDFVREFLANSAAENSFAVDLSSIRLEDVVSGVLSHFEGAARRKQIEMVYRPAQEPTAVWSDPSALRQVLENLVSNALKFSPPDKRVEVRIHRRDSTVEIHVADQGPGFTPEDRDRMFRRYGRLSARPTGGEPSTGLGLSIARRLVRAVNGELECQSEPERGATFIVRLPAEPNEI